MVQYIKDLLAKRGWWKGEVRIPYNLMWVLIVIGILLLPVVLVVAVAAAILYGIWWLAGRFLDGILFCLKWLCPYLAAFWAWLCSLMAALWAWLMSLFNRKPAEKKPAEKKEKKNWWWLLLLFLLFLLLLFGLLKDCSCSGRSSDGEELIEVVEPEQAWSDVVVYRVHLDTLRNDSRLIGLKNRGLKKADSVAFNGDALAESEEVVENEWTALVKKNVRTSLARPQMAATILYAMRCGRYGFVKSDFLKSLNEGNFAKASENILKLHRADGSVRANGREATCYLYELRLIFEGGLSTQEVLDCHRLSYKLYPADQDYEPEALKKVILTKGIQNQTVRQILEAQ